jgi:hypothetical protein
MVRVTAVVLTLLALPRLCSAQWFAVQVTDSVTGVPIPFATVSLLEPSLAVIRSAVVADSVGRLLVPAPKAGRYRLSIRRLGYSPVTTDTKKIDGNDTLRVSIRLAPLGVRLDTVNVTARGVEARELELRRNFGRGKIVSRVDIEHMGYLNLGDVLTSKGLQARKDRGGWRILCSRYNLFLNGFQQNVAFDDRDALSWLLDTELRHVTVVEVYPSRLSVPPEYALGTPDCAIAIWTRPLR